MKLALFNFNICTTLLLSGAAFTYAFPKDNLITSNITEVISSETKTSQQVIERPCSRRDFKKILDKSKDVIMYHENRDDGVLKSLCWAEIFIITENNYNKEKNLSNEFAIILESPGDITQQRVSEEDVEAYTLFDNETKKNKTLNFTIVNKTKELTIKQHKILHCGAGPVLIKTYIEWPKINKQKIEIRLIPATPPKWQIYPQNSIDYTTLFPDFQTFDTTNTESYSYTDIEGITTSLLESKTYKTFERDTTLEKEEESDNLNTNLGSKREQYGSDEVLKSRHDKESAFKPNTNFKINDMDLVMKQYGSNEVLKSKHDKESPFKPNTNFKINDMNLVMKQYGSNEVLKSKHDKESAFKPNTNFKINDMNLVMKQYGSNEVLKSKHDKGSAFKPNIYFKINGTNLVMKRELLTRNTYLKKLCESEDMFNTTERNFLVNPEYDMVPNFFETIYLNSSTSLWLLKGNHKFVIKAQISIEHIIIEDVNGAKQEMLESVMEWEEKIVYQLKRN